MSDGGPALSADRVAQINAANAAPPSDKPKTLDEFISSLMEMPMRIISKLTPVNAEAALKTGVFVNADITKAGIQVNNQIMKANPLAISSNIGNMIAEGVQVASVKDFSGVKGTAVEGIPVQAAVHIPMSDLFVSMPPSHTPNISAPERSMGNMIG